MICCALILSVIVVVILLLIMFLPIILVVIGALAIVNLPDKIGGGQPATVTREDALALEYPYQRLYMSDSQLTKAFKNIQNYRYNLVKTDYKILNMPHLTREQLSFRNGDEPPAPTIIELAPEDYATMNWMSNWFNERCRVQCKRYDEEQSPLEYWAIHKTEIIDAVRGPLTIQRLHDDVYRRVRGCNNFRPGLMGGAIKHFGAKSVLDPSAGWGDRLIGAIAAGATYVGVDPNECVHVGYNEIIEKFAPQNKANYTTIIAPFQDCELPRGPDGLARTYDLVFTSPPYFDLEIYSDADTQSVREFNKLDLWFDNFLIKSLRKAWAVLQNSGHMVIIINNIRGGDDFVMRMVDIVSQFPGADYLGVLSYADKISHRYKSPQPMWVWAKKTQADDGPAAESAQGGFYEKYLSIDMTEDEFLKSHQCVAEEDQDVTRAWKELKESCWLLTPNTSDNILHREPNSIYYGRVGDTKSAWLKKELVLNPKIIVDTVHHGDKEFRVVRDDLLPGGTKQRGIGVVATYPQNELIYAGPWNGYAQVALSIAGKIYNKTITLFMTRDDYITNTRAKMFGGHFKVIPGATLKELRSAAEQYARGQDDRRLMEFGFDSPEFRGELERQIIAALAGVEQVDRDFAQTIWLVAGSGTLLSVLYKVFPRANFAVVQVGKTIWPDQTDPSRTKIYTAPESFYNEAAAPPPFPSAARYDAKVWQFVEQHGQSGDMVWNVAE